MVQHSTIKSDFSENVHGLGYQKSPISVSSRAKDTKLLHSSSKVHVFHSKGNLQKFNLKY